MTSKNILASIYYPNNQHSSLIIFDKFILHIIAIQYFHPWDPPQVPKKIFWQFSNRSLYIMMKLSVLITNIIFFYNFVE
jgi:hypothetical protein